VVTFGAAKVTTGELPLPYMLDFDALISTVFLTFTIKSISIYSLPATVLSLSRTPNARHIARPPGHVVGLDRMRSDVLRLQPYFSAMSKK
jgi:hypothetical protein